MNRAGRVGYTSLATKCGHLFQFWHETRVNLTYIQVLNSSDSSEPLSLNQPLEFVKKVFLPSGYPQSVSPGAYYSESHLASPQVAVCLDYLRYVFMNLAVF